MWMNIKWVIIFELVKGHPVAEDAEFASMSKHTVMWGQQTGALNKFNKEYTLEVRPDINSDRQGSPVDLMALESRSIRIQTWIAATL